MNPASRDKQGLIRRLWNGGLVSQETIDALQQSHVRDWVGDRCQFAFACLLCGMIAAPMSFVELAGAPIAVVFLLRLTIRWRLGLWRQVLSVFVQPIGLALIALAAWMAISLIWTRDVRLGFEELGSLRWGWMLFALYPVLDRRRTLIICLAIGYLIANGVQALHFIGTLVGWEAVTFGRMPDRISGWWQPVVGGTMLVGALGLHLPAAFMGRGRVQVFGVVGSIITFLGVIATGSRGPWLAAGALIAIVGAVAVWRLRRAARLRTFVIGAVCVVLVAGAAWLAIGGSITRRVELAHQEITTAMRDKQFDSDTGARLLMWWWAIEATAEHPIGGVGAGGYPGWVRSHLASQDIDPSTRRIHDHAHSTVLHISATTGLVGAALSALLLVVALRGALHDVERLGDYEAGPFFAIIGLMLAGAFDPVHVNAQSAAMLCVLLALCQYRRPGGAS